jgi:hypothetical protein
MHECYNGSTTNHTLPPTPATKRFMNFLQKLKQSLGFSILEKDYTGASTSVLKSSKIKYQNHQK